jgi:hypothetical protein
MEIRKSLNGESLLGGIRKSFEEIPDHRRANGTEISLPDTMMSAFAIFSLKFPSLLQFEDAVKNEREGSNLIRMFGLTVVPSDTRMREILDEVEPDDLRAAYKFVFRELQRGKELGDFLFYDDYYLLALDGTGYFYSGKVHCSSCLQKKVKSKRVYHHQALGAALIHPGKSQVIPLYPEGIRNTDGQEKNDCERNAARRFLKNFREDHPRLKAIVTEDALGANAPHIKDITDYELSYILAVKPTGHTTLFSTVNFHESQKEVRHIERQRKIGDKIEKTVTEKFRYINRVELNDKSGCITNFLEYWETTEWKDSKGKQHRQKRHFSWVTDIELTDQNIEKIMRGGRARWKIENETFNTLKNQGYEFEHNFGHGKKNLSRVFVAMMMLVFLFDQAQEIGCTLFQEALTKCHGKRSRLWQKVRGLYQWDVVLSSWTQLLEFIAGKKWKMVPDTS